MSVDIIHVARDIAETIYRELPDGINELKRKELAQKIALELTSKVYNSMKKHVREDWFEYELWCEYELMLSSESRKRIHEVLRNIR